MSDKSCNLFDSCESAEAPLCPIQESTVKHGVWYPDEPICQASQFQELSWIKKQRQIAALRLKSGAGFFTVRMLEALPVILPGINGADPDYPNGEDRWFEEREIQVKGKRSKQIEKKIVKERRPMKPFNIMLFKDTDFLPPTQKKEKKSNVKNTVPNNPVKRRKIQKRK